MYREDIERSSSIDSQVSSLRYVLACGPSPVEIVLSEEEEGAGTADS